MRILSLTKRFAALVAAAVVSLAVFGGIGCGKGTKVYPDGSISGFAEENDENAMYESQMAELELKKSELDKKIADAGSDIKGNQEKLDAVKEKAATIEKKIKKVSARASKLEDEMCELDAEIRETQYNLEEAEADIAVGIEEFNERLRAMYIAGNDSYTEVLVNADNFYDVLMRVELVKRVAKHDNEAIDKLLKQKAQIEAYQAELDEQNEALKVKSGEYAERQADLSAQSSELLQMQEEYGGYIDGLLGDISEYQLQLDAVNDEYGKVSAAAATTTTTTTAAETTAEKESSETKATTTKKSTTDGGDKPKTTTTTKKQGGDPESSTTKDTEPPQTNTTTKKQTTTTQAPTPVPDPEPPVNSDRQTKINTVVSYAKSMVGGRYVWGGSQFGATDCSGLVMLSYAQIGISLPHNAAMQASYGTSVSESELQPGDLVFYGGSYSSIYHVSMYIGDGKIVHAESSATGIVMSYYDTVARYNHVCCIKRLI